MSKSLRRDWRSHELFFTEVRNEVPRPGSDKNSASCDNTTLLTTRTAREPVYPTPPWSQCINRAPCRLPDILWWMISIVRKNRLCSSKIKKLGMETCIIHLSVRNGPQLLPWLYKYFPDCYMTLWWDRTSTIYMYIYIFMCCSAWLQFLHRQE